MTAVDWFRLLWDLVQRGVNLAEISRRTGISAAALHGYLAHSHPSHWRGELLISLWCEVCETHRDDLPTEKLSMSPRIVEKRAGPKASEADELTKVVGGWR